MLPSLLAVEVHGALITQLGFHTRERATSALLAASESSAVYLFLDLTSPCEWNGLDQQTCNGAAGWPPRVGVPQRWDCDRPVVLRPSALAQPAQEGAGCDHRHGCPGAPDQENTPGRSGRWHDAP